ncbi:bifunctional metallophosphatase/5'-nucleotidase [Thauera sinica]|uniref:5'-nucleotidase C-terminal domain-containing protein n=1 Tax=Thauera sinica TaxID=2665146 RepID=A0ABW1ANH3_9RHOO|nr:5'-nucleotidase C-terminal domain-containing protein [Thauera sp. K11]ATE60512.1 alkaline phosphatase [Thauera sp. K11]
MLLRSFRINRLAAAVVFAVTLPASALAAEGLTILHVGDQESWLLSAQGNLRDDASQALSFYGGIDRLASLIGTQRNDAYAAGNSVLTLNAGDAFLPGPRLTASLQNLATSFADGGQDFYDAIAMRYIGFDAAVFGNHEFDLGADVAARFAQVSGTTYLSSNLDFGSSSAFGSLVTAGTVAPSMITTTTGGNKVGIVGLTTPLLPTISSPGDVGVIGNVAGATAAQNLQATVSIVQAQIDALRAQGANTVVLMSHLQNVSNEINVVVPQLRGADIIISGGGHELMAEADDILIPGAEAASIKNHPVAVQMADGNSALVVTANFGNRYLGELNVTLDDNGFVQRDANGVPVINSASMLRVAGIGDDAVTPDATLNAQVVQPVQTFIEGLNAQIIATSEVNLNGNRGAAGAPGSFVVGVRNSETNLGNLMADALRFSGKTDVAIQNGGGIRDSISEGDVSAGDTFDVAPFTNLVKTAQNVSGAQLKEVLEHTLANASPNGNAAGQFGQISGMKVRYDTNAAAGARVLDIVLDDGTVLVKDGVVVNTERKVTLATIDFLAGGGDGYPFAEAGVEFDNAVNTVTYQEALLDFITTPEADGGLGGRILASRYGVENPYDYQGRLVDMALAVPEPETYAMLLAGLGLIGFMNRRRKQAVAA